MRVDGAVLPVHPPSVVLLADVLHGPMHSHKLPMGHTDITAPGAQLPLHGAERRWAVCTLPAEQNRATAGHPRG